jgi:hypothetical protein
MNVQTMAQKAAGNGFLPALIANEEPEGFRESLWDAIELLRADYTSMKLLRKEFSPSTACFPAFGHFCRIPQKVRGDTAVMYGL